MPRRFRRRSMRMAPVIQSFKKVLNDAPASRLSGTNISTTLSSGQDSVAAGQTTPTDANVPTGSVIKFFEIQWGLGNLTGANLFIHCAIELIHSGQSLIPPNAVGGSPQRNQVFFQSFFHLGTEQSGTRRYGFKVPKRFQRVREGDQWRFIRNGDAVYVDGLQVIYKFYR